MSMTLIDSWIRMVILALAGGVGASAVAQVAVVQIPPKDAVEPSAVHGLKVFCYNFERLNPIGTPGIDSVKIARNYTERYNPDVSYELKARHIDFPVGVTDTFWAAGTEMRDYFTVPLVDSGKPPANPAYAMSSRNIFVYKGFIHVTRAGTYTFRVVADDGSEMTIGGAVVHSLMSGGIQGRDWEPYIARVEFAAPGIYPVKILHFDVAQRIGIEVYADLEPLGDLRDFSPQLKLNLLTFLTDKPGLPAE